MDQQPAPLSGLVIFALLAIIVWFFLRRKKAGNTSAIKQIPAGQCKLCGEQVGVVNLSFGTCKTCSEKEAIGINKYKVSFNSAFTVDKFGFRGKGTVSISENGIEYRGKKSWAPASKFILWFLLLVAWLFISRSMGIVPISVAGMMSAFMPIFLIIFVQAVCKSDDTLHLGYNKISNFSVKDNNVKFDAISLEGKKAKSFFKVIDTEKTNEIAQMIESYIKNK